MHVIWSVDIKRTKCTVACWQFDILGRFLTVQQEMIILNRPVNCVAIWSLYVGTLGEASNKRLLWLLTKDAMKLDWGNRTSDITRAGIFGISNCFYGFGHCTLLMLAVLT